MVGIGMQLELTSPQVGRALRWITVAGIMECGTLLWLPSCTNTGCKQCGRHSEHIGDLYASLLQARRAALAHAHDGRGATAADVGKGAEVVAYLIDGLIVLLRVGCNNREGVGILHQVDRDE